MKTKLFFFFIFFILVGCENNCSIKAIKNEVSETDSIVYPQDFGNGVFYFNLKSPYKNYSSNNAKEVFGKSVSDFQRNNTSWKIVSVSPMLEGAQYNYVVGYFVICEKK